MNCMKKGTGAVKAFLCTFLSKSKFFDGIALSIFYSMNH